MTALKLRTALGVALVAAHLLGGCPREVDEPPAAGDPCETIEDCNVETCGALRACVEQRCEADRSVLVPCP